MSELDHSKISAEEMFAIFMHSHDFGYNKQTLKILKLQIMKIETEIICQDA